jgi:DNA-directed RNA polymerase specialized sigma subunit
MRTVDDHQEMSDDVASIISATIGPWDREDPMRLYVRATHIRNLYDEVNVELEKLRGLALARMNGAGMSYRAIAEHVGISSARVQQLINKAREAG